MPFFIAALVLVFVIVLVEVGQAGILRGPAQAPSSIAEVIPEGDSELSGALAELEPGEIQKLLAQDRPPGLAIRAMALLDGCLLFAVGLMGLSLLIRERLQARVQGCATFVFGLLIVLGAIAVILGTLALVILMISLLLSVPFGTLAYLALYGFFNRGGANAMLGLLMTLKLAFAICLVVAQQRFLQNKGLVLLIITSFLANVIISFLHGLVPRFLVSITDGIAAIVMGVLAAIWALILLIGSIPGIIKALNISRL